MSTATVGLLLWGLVLVSVLGILVGGLLLVHDGFRYPHSGDRAVWVLLVGLFLSSVAGIVRAVIE